MMKFADEFTASSKCESETMVWMNSVTGHVVVSPLKEVQRQ